MRLRCKFSGMFYRPFVLDSIPLKLKQEHAIKWNSLKTHMNDANMEQSQIESKKKFQRIHFPIEMKWNGVGWMKASARLKSERQKKNKEWWIHFGLRKFRMVYYFIRSWQINDWVCILNSVRTFGHTDNQAEHLVRLHESKTQWYMRYVFAEHYQKTE